ncbi:MAG TPA: hypothetical protein VGF55_24655 [Gemmataceae bacterium]|jgi:hypothetical protein
MRRFTRSFLSTIRQSAARRIKRPLPARRRPLTLESLEARLTPDTAIATIGALPATPSA